MALPVVQSVAAGETDANITFEILSASKSSRYGQLYKIEYKKKSENLIIRLQYLSFSKGKVSLR